MDLVLVANSKRFSWGNNYRASAQWSLLYIRRRIDPRSPNHTQNHAQSLKMLRINRVRQFSHIRSFSSTSRALNSGSSLPLAGVRVVDMSRVLAGPYCTQLLADLGADVIKIEHPTRGDDTRAWGPPFAPYTKTDDSLGVSRDMVEVAGTAPGESAYFLCVNRNKKSVGLSFQSDEGKAALKRLIASADVFVENYVPGTLKRYGLSYDDLKDANPKLIYTSITGYGQTGPYSHRPGYDVMVEAEMGLMHITGEPDGAPSKVGVAVTDLTTGLYASNSVLAALIKRGVSGKGTHIDASLADCQVASLANIASQVLISGKPDSGRQGTAHPSICPYQAFDTADGSIMIGGGNDNLFKLACDALGKPEWKTDPRFLSNALRVKNRDILVPAIHEVTKTKKTNDWVEIFKVFNFPFAAINDIQTTLSNEHVVARDMIQTVDHPVCGPMKLVGVPVKFSDKTSQPNIRMPPPLLGQHTFEVFREVGYSDAEINKLVQDGVIRGRSDSV